MKKNNTSFIRAKNILRGLEKVDDSRKTRSAIKTMIKECTLSDVIYVTERLRKYELYKDNGVYGYFISDYPSTTDSVIQTPVNIIVENLLNNKDRLLRIIKDYNLIAKDIFEEKKYDSAFDKIELSIKTKGFSLFVIKMLFLLKYRLGSLKDLSYLEERVNDKLDDFVYKKSKYFSNAIKRLLNQNTDYFNVCDSLLKSNTRNKNFFIIKSFINPMPQSKDDFLSILSAHYDFSLIDSLLYLLMINKIDKNIVDDKNNSLGVFLSYYEDMSNINIGEKDFFDNDDVIFFRSVFLLLDFDCFFKYKVIHGSIYNNKYDGFMLTSFQNKLIENYFSDVKSLPCLCEEVSNNINLKKYNKESSGVIENSTALIYVLQKIKGKLNKNDISIFVKLMSQTQDIGVICPSNILEEILLNSENYQLKIVSACLYYIKNNSTYSEQYLRAVVDDILEENNYSLLYFFDLIYGISPSVTRYLVEIFDEDFITKLFSSVESPINAIEIRSSILEWYGSKINNSLLIERSKNLRIDLQLNKYKEEIDGARVYVDLTRFYDWMNSHHLNELIVFLSEFNDNMTNIRINWSDLDKDQSLQEQIASILKQSYNEFCNNSSFGISSFLGRRIRHGTFKGTMLKDLQDIKQDCVFNDVFGVKEVSDKYNSWLNQYEKMIDDLVKDNFYINSKEKPKGIFFSYFNSRYKQRIADILFDEICSSYRKSDNATQLPFIIAERYWLCVDEDLKAIKDLLVNEKSKYGLFKLDHTIGDHKNEKIQRLVQQVNTIVSDKFRTIMSWFNKPTTSASQVDIAILFNVVVEEVKSSVSGFNPELIKTENCFIISGGYYYTIYDAIFIFVHNSAIHGKKDGKLECSISDHDNFIRLSISSEIDIENISEDSIRVKISDLLGANNCNFDDAHVKEGNSGILKLKKMESDGYIKDLNIKVDNNKVIGEFSFDLQYIVTE